MAQSRWAMIMAQMVPMGLLIVVTASIIFLLLLNTSMRISNNDFQSLDHIFSKEQNTLDFVVPLGEPSLYFEKNLSQFQKNLSQIFIQNITQIVWPLKATIKYGISNGLIIIVNASSEDEMKSIFVSASQNRATSSQWDINDALDGYVGELFAEVIEEVHNIEEVQSVIVEIMKNCNCNNNLERIQVQKNISQENTNMLNDWPYKLHWYGQSLHSLVVFSSFRFSHTEFFIVALLGILPSEKLHTKESKIDACAWINWEEQSINQMSNYLNLRWHKKHMPTIQLGSQSIIITNELHKIAYDVAVIKCTFEDPVGTNAKGGHLYIKKNNDFCPVFHEAIEEFNTLQFEGKFKYDFAYCSTPILWEFNAIHLKEWFMYHHFFFHMKKIHYFIYHGIDITNKIMTILNPLIKQGLLTLIDMRSPQSNLLGGQYPSHYLAINDCLHRVRYITKWAFFWSFEDYLTISSHNTLSSILDKYKNDPWISFGSILWSNTYCCALDHQAVMFNKTMWIVDEMCFRMEHPICNDKKHTTTCFGNDGQRKWIANPRLVFAASIHYALEPQLDGIILDTSIARFNVYKGLLNPSLNRNMCVLSKLSRDFDEDRLLDGKWWKDLSIRNTTQAAHFYASSTKLFNSYFVNSSPIWPP